jgi:hypothetical protein
MSSTRESQSSTTCSRSPTSTTPADEALRRWAEYAFDGVPARHGHFKEDFGSYALYASPYGGNVERLRIDADSIDTTREAAHAWFLEHGVTEAHWEISEDATPPDLYERLLARGLEPAEGVTAMVITEPPPKAEGIDVRPLETREELEELLEIAWESFELSRDERASARTRHDQAWAGAQTEYQQHFLARIDGEIVGGATLLYTPGGGFLMGGNVRADARGRGAYRALVRARWDDAVEKGTPFLGVHAGEMSRPILAGLGFRTMLEVRRLRDVPH